MNQHLLVTLLISASCVVPLTAGHAESSILPNPNFESWEDLPPASQLTFERANVNADSERVPDGWIIFQVRTPEEAENRVKTTLSQDSEIKHSGSSSLKITISEPGGVIGITNRSGGVWNPVPLALTPGKSYVLRGWIRSEGVQSPSGKPAGVSLRLADNEKSFFSQETKRRFLQAKLPPLEEATEWTPFEVAFETEPNEAWGQSSIELPAGIQGTVWLDDLSLTEAP